MTSGWRNRFMAPLYALVISFVLVVILGAVLNDPMRIWFTTPEGELHTQENVHVLVKTADDRTELANTQLDGSREISLLNPHKDIVICLPKIWLLKGWNLDPDAAPKAAEPAESCWRKAQQDQDKAQCENIEITRDQHKDPNQPIPPNQPKPTNQPKTPDEPKAHP